MLSPSTATLKGRTLTRIQASATAQAIASPARLRALAHG
jgi:hypothetical protein